MASRIRGPLAIQIRQAQIALPTGPVTASKAWIEMAHRYFALAVGVLITVLTVEAWRRAGREGHFAVVDECGAGLGLRARPIRCAHSDDETATRNRDAAPLGRNRPTGDFDLDRAARGARRETDRGA